MYKDEQVELAHAILCGIWKLSYPIGLMDMIDENGETIYCDKAQELFMSILEEIEDKLPEIT